MPSTKSYRKKPAVVNGRNRATTCAPRVASIWNLVRHLSDPTRIQILLMLADGKKSATQIAKGLGQAPLAFSHHLSSLRFFELVDSSAEDNETYYELTEPGARFVDSTLGLLYLADSSPRPVIPKSEWKKLVKKVGSDVNDPEVWLDTPNPQFEWRRPIDLIGTEDEVRVHIIIEAAAAGCFY
jgi:DNA-binding transcriptional ArsR family regulator